MLTYGVGNLTKKSSFEVFGFQHPASVVLMK